MASNSAPVEPDTIGPYRVIRPIARGGMASVYEVEDIHTNERLALKLLTQPGLAIPRFNREYRALSRLNHANIVRVYRFGLTDDGQPFLTMELLDGVAAQVYAKSCGRPGTPRRTLEVIRIVAAVADALDYLHDRGIVHRDLKSSNVLVQRDGSVKLLDFGTARLLESMDQITRHGEFIGTFAYASPEQLTGRKVDGQADLYSLGVLFYRLLTGKRPFEAQSLHELAKMHIEKAPRPPNELAPGIPEPVTELVLQMLAKEPDRRPPGAASVSQALRSWSRSSPRNAAGLGLTQARMVGRDEELALIREMLGEPREGAMVVIGGQPGSGRMRLIQQMSTEAREKGWRVYEASFPGPPGLGALGEIARIVSRSLPQQEGIEPSEEVLASAERTETDGDGSLSSVRAQIFDRIADAFVRRAELDNRPMGLFLHELHRAPPLAIDALAAIRERSRTSGQAILVFASTTEDADRPGQPLRMHFHDARRICLPPLGRDQIGALIASMLGLKSPPPQLARRLYEATGGLPGYVEEVIRAMVQAGLVVGKEAPGNQVEWVDKSEGQIAIPATARESVSQRLEATQGNLLRYLEALAVAGGRAGTAALAYAVDVPPAEARAALHDLVHAGVLRGGQDRAHEDWRFCLGMTSELLLERMRDSRRQAMERRLAEALWEEPATRHKLRLLEAAGFVDKAIQDAIPWVDEALEARRGAEVLQILDRLVGRVAEVRDLPPTQVARLFLSHARAVTATDPSDTRADQSFARAAALSTDPRLRAEVDLHAARLSRVRGELERARTSLERAQGRLQGSPDLHLSAMVSQDLGELAMAAGKYPDALVSFQNAQRSGEHAHELAVEARARVGCGRVRTAMGDLTSAENDFIHAGEAFARIRDESGRWLAASEMAALYRQQARFSEAMTGIESNMAAVRQAGRLYQYVRMLVALIEVEVDMYRLGEAREHLAEVLALGVSWEDPHVDASVARVQGRLLLAADEPDQAAEVLQRAVAAAEANELPLVAHWLRAYLGQAKGQASDPREGDALTAEAIRGLEAGRFVTALGDACVCRSVALHGNEDPDVTFKPVLSWFDREPARLVHMYYLLSAAEFARSTNVDRRAIAMFNAAREMRDQIGELLSPADRNGLEVHPWTTRILRGIPPS